MSGRPVLEPVWRDGQMIRVMFLCPGCRIYHTPVVNAPDGGPVWEFNQDLVRPTLSPSILVTGEFGEDRVPQRCHSFVRGGRIEFLSDCTHALAGQAVDLPPIPEGGA